MSYEIACPHCAQRFAAQERMAGKTVNCPTCGQGFQVPAAPEVGSSAALTPLPPKPQSDLGSLLDELPEEMPATRVLPSTPVRKSAATGSAGRTWSEAPAMSEDDKKLLSYALYALFIGLGMLILPHFGLQFRRLARLGAALPIVAAVVTSLGGVMLFYALRQRLVVAFGALAGTALALFVAYSMSPDVNPGGLPGHGPINADAEPDGPPPVPRSRPAPPPPGSPAVSPPGGAHAGGQPVPPGASAWAPPQEPGRSGQPVTLWDFRKEGPFGNEFSVQYRLDGLQATPADQFVWIVDTGDATAEFEFRGDELNSRGTLQGKVAGIVHLSRDRECKSWLERGRMHGSRTGVSNVVALTRPPGQTAAKTGADSPSSAAPGSEFSPDADRTASADRTTPRRPSESLPDRAPVAPEVARPADYAGSDSGTPFRSVAPENGVLVGLQATLGGFGQMGVIKAIEPFNRYVPVEDTSACRTGFLDCAAAATIGADPSPDSLLKRPRAIP